MAKDMKSYKYRSMWAEDTKDVENGTNDVDDFITGHIRTDRATISFNGAWAQNLDQRDMYVDFLGDKGGARLDYGKQFVFCNGETLESTQSEHEIPNMYRREDVDFLASIDSGVKNRNHIDNVLESAKLLDALYRSAEQKRELRGNEI
jgi:predicted dehydrogenase